MPQFETAGQIVNAAGVELGLIPFGNQPADPFGSTNANIGRLCQLLITAGKQLRASRQWTNLRFVYTFTMDPAVSNTATPALPRDYAQFIDQTAWNRTNRLPLGGPLSPQEYEYLKARLVGVVFTVLFQVVNGQFHTYPDTNSPGSYVIAYEYVSNQWAVPAGSQVTLFNAYGRRPWLPTYVYLPGDYVLNNGRYYSTDTGGTSGEYGPISNGAGIVDGTVTWIYQAEAGADTLTASGDVILFDSVLVSRLLKLLWKKELGFDYSAAKDDFDAQFGRACDDDSVSPVLNLGRGRMEEPLIGERNIPYSGFGS